MVEPGTIETREANNIPTVKDVLNRPFTRPDSPFKLASALVAKDGPIYWNAQKAKFAINPYPGFAQNCNADALSLIRQVVVSGKEKRVVKTDAEKKDLEKYYGEQLVKGVDQLVDVGYIPRDLADLVMTHMLSGKVVVADGTRSSFGYIHLVFPGSERAELDISPEHISQNAQLLNKDLKAVGLEDRLSEDEINEVATREALLHEFGHATERTIQILLAGKIIREREEFASRTYEDLRHPRYGEPSWEFYERMWDLVDEELVEKYQEIEGENREQTLRGLGVEGSVADSYIEAISTACEYSGIDAYLSERGFSEEERKSLFNHIKSENRRALSDFKYFVDILKSRGITSSDQYHELLATAYETRHHGINLMDHVPFSGPELKQVGYYLPLYPEHFKVITRLVDPETAT